MFIKLQKQIKYIFNIEIKKLIMRSVWKGPFIDNNVLNEIYELQKAGKKKVPVKIVFKGSVIFPSFV